MDTLFDILGEVFSFSPAQAAIDFMKEMWQVGCARERRESGLKT